MQKVIVPNEFKVGFVNRNDTFSGKLGYMIYGNREDGTYGQQKSYDGWRDKSIEEKFIKNQYQLGFVLNKGRLNHYRFGASAKFRVFHPEGFEFEISLENLSLILGYTTVSSGEINLPCCIGWIGKNCYLIPQIDLNKELEIIHENIEEKQIEGEKLKKIKEEKNAGKPIQKRSLVGGRIVETKDGERFYISKLNYSNQRNVKLRASVLDSIVNDYYKLRKVETKDNVIAMFSLSKAYGKVKADTVFVKFVEQSDLSVDEEGLFLKYSQEDVIFFNKDFVFKKFNIFNEEEINDTFNNLMGMKNGRYYEGKLMSGHFVKKNGVLYGLKIGGHIYYSKYNVKKVIRLSEGVERYRGENFDFFPILSLNEKNNVFITDSYSIDISESCPNWKKIIQENFEELTSEDIEIANKKALRLFE
jgi:hypothetical protein